MLKNTFVLIVALLVAAPAFANEQTNPAETVQVPAEQTCPTCTVETAPETSTEAETKKELTDEEVQQLINEMIKQAEAEKAAQDAAKQTKPAEQVPAQAA